MSELGSWLRARWFILRGKRFEAFCSLWGHWPKALCPSCGADETHADYWLPSFIEGALRFAASSSQRTRNPAMKDCWRLDLTDRFQLQKTPMEKALT